MTVRSALRSDLPTSCGSKVEIPHLTDRAAMQRIVIDQDSEDPGWPDLTPVGPAREVQIVFG